MTEPPHTGRALSAETIQAVKDGDSSAWESLYLSYRDQLLFSIRCRLGAELRSRLQSEDILHSVVKDVLRDIGKNKIRADSSLDHYLHVCCLNKIRDKADYFAALKRSGSVPLSDTILDRVPNPGEGEPRYSNAEKYEKLEKCLVALPEGMREILILRRIEELSNTEAADVLSKTPEATSKLYNRALARLGLLMGSE